MKTTAADEENMNAEMKDISNTDDDHGGDDGDSGSGNKPHWNTPSEAEGQKMERDGDKNKKHWNE